jgi:GT2 family glycosyltransferase
VDWLLGACLMVKKGRIINIGLFDEKYELYCEDIDLCYSLKKANFNNYYINKAEIYHYHQKESDNKFLSKRTYIHFKSMFYFIKKQKYMLNLFNG